TRASPSRTVGSSRSAWTTATRRSTTQSCGSAPPSTPRSQPATAGRCPAWGRACACGPRTSTRRSHTTSASTSSRTETSSTPGQSTCAVGSDLATVSSVTDELALLDATDHADAIRRGDLTPLEAVDAAVNRIEKLNGELNAVIHPLFEKARASAGGALPDGPVRGVPIVVKDLDGTSAGDPCHNGNKLLKQLGYVADHDSYLFAKLRAAGFV